MDRFGWTTITAEYQPEQRIRLFRRDQMPARARHLLKAEILACLAEGYWLRRALRAADDPDQHAIFLDVSRAADLGEGGRFAAEAPGLTAALAGIYANTRGEVEAWACRAADGSVQSSAGNEAEPGTGTRYVLKIVGLCVRDFFALEDGTHVWTSLARGPEVVRVRVIPATSGATPAEVLEEALPATLPPVVRKLRYDPPRAGGAPVPFEIEDYPMGYAETVAARRLSDALAPLWLMRASREEIEEEGASTSATTGTSTSTSTGTGTGASAGASDDDGTGGAR
jgi:ATP-dependent Clp protease ATP-binding subunit ClpA/ATP-dependent Clp protease ATP-binding subunit ClpC